MHIPYNNNVILSENELIQKAKVSDKRAWSALYQLYSKLWYSICLRYHANADDAADALQNALIRMYGSIHQYDEAKGKFKSWSNQIVVNENLMLLRQRKEITALGDADFQSEEDQEDKWQPVSAEELTKMIRELPKGCRTVFNMYVLDGFDHVEISQVLNISVGTSKSQLSKAKKLLRQKVEVLI